VCLYFISLFFLFYHTFCTLIFDVVCVKIRQGVVCVEKFVNLLVVVPTCVPGSVMFLLCLCLLCYLSNLLHYISRLLWPTMICPRHLSLAKASESEILCMSTWGQVQVFERTGQWHTLEPSLGFMRRRAGGWSKQHFGQKRATQSGRRSVHVKVGFTVS
jgi:hypothetical protein